MQGTPLLTIVEITVPKKKRREIIKLPFLETVRGVDGELEENGRNHWKEKCTSRGLCTLFD